MAIKVKTDFAVRLAVIGAQTQVSDVLMNASDSNKLGQDTQARFSEVHETLAVEAHVNDRSSIGWCKVGLTLRGSACPHI